jgi:hypothetical protein
MAGVCLAAVLGSAGCIPSEEAPQDQAEVAPPPAATAGTPAAEAPGANVPDAPPLKELLARWDAYAADPAANMDSPEVRQLVGDLAYYYGNEGWQPLYDKLGSPDAEPLLKVMITSYLSTYAHQIVMTDSLLELTETGKDETTRACATHLLSLTQNPQLEERFKELAQDSEPRVRLSALMGLAGLGNHESQQALAGYYWQPDATLSERENVVVALARAPYEDQAPIFEDAIANEQLSLDVRLTAVQALGLVGGPEGAATLEELAKSAADPSVRKTAELSLQAVQQRQKLNEPAQE